MDKTAVDNLVERLVAGYSPHLVLLFGSQARGDADESSDVDILVVKETEERFLDRLNKAYSFLPPGPTTDLLVYTPQEFREMVDRGNPFVVKALSEGVILYERPDEHGRCRYAGMKQALETGELAMKPDPSEESRRWMQQAEQFFESAIYNLRGGMYALSCFLCQQAAETALKAFLYSRGERLVRTHSVEELRKICEAHEAEFGAISREAKKLDRLYLTTRYPDALPGGVPAENFDDEDAQEALARTSRVMDLVKKHLEHKA